MPRAKGGYKSRRRRNRIRKHAQGFRGGRSKLWKAAVEAVHRKWRYALFHRRKRKPDFRGLWITRINAAARDNGISYSRLIASLDKANIPLDPKILQGLAIRYPVGFKKVIEAARAAWRFPVSAVAPPDGDPSAAGRPRLSCPARTPPASLPTSIGWPPSSAARSPGSWPSR